MMLKVYPPDEAKKRAKENLAAWKRQKEMDACRRVKKEESGNPPVEDRPAPIEREDLATTLLKAASAGDAKEVVQVLSEGADPEARNEHGMSALMLACANAHIKAARALVAHGADVKGEWRNPCGTPLTLACAAGCVAIAELLLDRGADINLGDRNDWTPLMWAAAHGRLDVANLLIERGADIGAEGRDGWTASILATNNGHDDVAVLLRFSRAKR